MLSPSPEECARKIRDGEINYFILFRWLKWANRSYTNTVMEDAVEWMLPRVYWAEHYEQQQKVFRKWAHTLPEPYQTQALRILTNRRHK